MEQVSARQRWSAARPTKTGVFWMAVAAAVVTMIVGFGWGGWVTGSTAGTMAKASAEEAVTKRLAPMCVIRARQDPKKDERFKELTDTSAWQRGDYVKKQGWATMPGEQEPDGRIADECAKLLVPAS
jgi:hypothetical protein